MLCHVIPWTSARQTPLSMDFSRQEYWSGLPTFYFFFFWLDWVFLALCGLSLVAVGGGGWSATLRCASQTSHCGDFSCCRAQTLGMGFTGSVFVVHRLNCSVACGIFLDQESNPCPLPTQADSSTVPPGKSMIQFYIFFLFQIIFRYSFLQDTKYSPLCYTIGLCCLPVLYIVIVSANRKLLIDPNPPPTLSPLVIMNLFSSSVSLFLFCE